MKQSIAIFALAMAMTLNAKAVEYKQYYADSNGKTMDAAQAIMSSMKGTEVFKCQSVEYKVSKSGTSIGVHNVKKPKVTKAD